MSTDDRHAARDAAHVFRNAQLRFAGPVVRACRVFAALGLPITWHQPGSGTIDVPGPDAATVQVETTAGSLLLAVLVPPSAVPPIRALGAARVGPRDGETVTIFVEILFAAASDEAEVRRAIETLRAALRLRAACLAA
jgi:hypothetical protein